MMKMRAFSLCLFIQVTALLLIDAQKCCDYGCSKRCLAPIDHKPGFCPLIRESVITSCDVQCKSDDSCPGSQKCCNYGCSIRCLNPIGLSPHPVNKPGFCPLVRKGVITTCDVQCKSDDSCPGSQKCCNYGCSIRCLNPTGLSPHPVNKPGFCPLVRKGVITTCDVQCKSDDSCPGSQKCCNYGCSIRCLNPTGLSPHPVNKPGFCPLVRKGVITTCDVQCKSDDSCPGSQKCCNYGCSIRCLNPTGLSPHPVNKPGFCPLVRKGVITTCDVQCKSDDSCPGSQKCCNYGCSIRCLNPTGLSPHPVNKPGFCPLVRKGVITTCDVQCKSDDSCPGSQKCCNYGCSIRCLNPTGLSPHPVNKPGFCPMRKGLITTFDVQCKSDNSCPGPQKCCDHGCSKRCLWPINLTKEIPMKL